jgi:agmatine deiminase
MSVRMPAEWAPHERTLVSWPVRASVWGPLVADAEVAYREVIWAVAQFEPCTVIVPPGPPARRAAQCCEVAQGSTPFPIDIVELPIDDSWIRDNGPIYVFDDHRRVVTDWRFNSWGGKYLPYDDDAALTRRWAEVRHEPSVSVDAVLEGGSINVDGEGSMVTTVQCLMQPNRNPALARVDLEALFWEHLGVDAVLWLPHGLIDDDDTDGHVDNVAAFCEPGRLLMQGCDDGDEPDAMRLDMNRRTAERWRDARGVPLEAVEIPVLPFVEIGGFRRPVPYLNFYVLNEAVLVPVTGHEADDDILEMLAEEFPGREVVGLDVGAVLALGGGGIHCITQQVPAV